MLRYGVLLIAVCAVLAAPAEAKAPGFQKQITALSNQVANLRGRVTALNQQAIGMRARLTTLETGQTTIAQNLQHLGDITDCNYAIESDNLNGVWHTLVLIAQYNGFPPQPDYPRYDDRGACARLGITRSR